MRTSLLASCSLVLPLAVVSSAGAATWYVSPDGALTTDCTTRDVPCDLASAASSAVAGDTVILMDGVYHTQLYVQNSGTESAWITFQADECATPIVEGPGVGPEEDNEDTGVGSAEAIYLRFVGIVSRGWSTGFGNGWTGEGTTNSNGNWEIINCIGDGNGRTGFTFYSAQGFHLKNSISAHNGSSTLHSWSSGVTLYESSGGAVIEGNVSFENTDAQKHTDGSGFIADRSSDDATFVNNVAFANGGSCLRLTLSSGTKFLNNTCYHNAQDAQAQGPPNPSEVYFTQESTNSTITNVTFMNNVFVNTGSGPGAMAIYNQPTSGWSNNVIKTGAVGDFTSTGNNPDFSLSSSATDLIGKGGTNPSAPMEDVGFDGKCIVKRTPELVGNIARASFWQYSIDIDYIKSIGGVAACFHPKSRSGTPDIGAYANGTVTTTTPGSCVPPPVTPMGGTGGMGGVSTGGDTGTGTGGVSAGGSAGVDAGGMATGGDGIGGSGAAISTGGVAATGGGPSGSGGAPSVTGGSPGGGTDPSGNGGASAGSIGVTAGSAAGGSPGAGGFSDGGYSGAQDGDGSEDDAAGCGCRLAGPSSASAWLAGFGLLGLALARRRRRRALSRAR